MPAEVADGCRQGGIVKVGDEPGQRLVTGRQPQAQLVRGAAEQPLVFGVGRVWRSGKIGGRLVIAARRLNPAAATATMSSAISYGRRPLAAWYLAISN